MKKVGVLLAVFLILGFFGLEIEAGEEVSYPLFRLTEAPVLDGQVRDDPAWEDLPQVIFVRLGCHSLPTKQTFFQMGYTAEALYIGVECEEAEMEKIKAVFGDMENLWGEDSVEVFIFPEGADSYFQFVINAIGSRWSYEFMPALMVGPVPVRERVLLGNWQAKVYQGEDYYSLEIRIPFEIFGVFPGDGEEWRGNITRNIFTPGDDKHTTWAHVKGGFHELDNFGRFLFAGEFSAEEARKITDRNINILRKKIVANLRVLPEMEKEIRKAKEYPALKREIASFLKNYEESYEKIRNRLLQLDTLREASLLLRKSRNLIKEADPLKGKILRQRLFDF